MSCAGTHAKPNEVPAPQAFYTVTAEIALTRHQPRVAALQYAAAAAHETDVGLLQRAAQVTADCLQPSLTEKVAARWIGVAPGSVDAQRAAAEAALALYKIDDAAAHYRIVLLTSPEGTDAEFAALETYLAGNDNLFGARQLADRLAASFPTSAAALRVQGFAALRADDPAAAVKSLTASLALPAPGGPPSDEDTRPELQQTLARARVMAGDGDEPIARAQAEVRRADTPANRLDYALLLMSAQRDAAAMKQLEALAKNPEFAPVALRLLGLLEFQQGRLDAAAARFAELLREQKYLDDAFYYLALIADRHDDPEHALRLYAQVRGGENAVPALLRAATLLHKHGGAVAAEELLDRLIEDEPQRAPAILTARARMYEDEGDLPRALSVLEHGTAEYPDSVDLRYAKASIYDEQGRVSDALRELGALLTLRPDDPSALNALGYTMADHSLDLGRARRLIESAYAAAPKNAAILDSLGWVLFREGRSVESEPYLQAAYADDRGGEIAAHLGEVLWQLGKPADAEHVWTEALAADRGNRLLKETRQRLHAAPPPAPEAQPAPILPPSPVTAVPALSPPLPPVTAAPALPRLPTLTAALPPGRWMPPTAAFALNPLRAAA